MLLRDHIAAEQPMMLETIEASSGHRHESVARASVAELEHLQDDWSAYLYRWDAEAVATRWPAFTDETVKMMERVRARVEFETSVLYSLALHFEVLKPGEHG